MDRWTLGGCYAALNCSFLLCASLRISALSALRYFCLHFSAFSIECLQFASIRVHSRFQFLRLRAAALCPLVVSVLGCYWAALNRSFLLCASPPISAFSALRYFCLHFSACLFRLRLAAL